MSDIITGAAIPDDVMREAAKAIDDMYWEDMTQCIATLNTALKILAPAIERSLIERMIADYRQGYDSEWGDIVEWLQSFLTTEDEEATT